jgi:hypothetical protein
MEFDINEKEAADMDKIVSYLITYDNFGEAKRFHEEVLPDDQLSYIQGLVDVLISYGRKVIVLAPQGGYYKFIRSGTSAPNFISKGGFTAIYKSLHDKKQQDDFASKLSVENLVLSVNKLRDDLAELPKTKRLAKNAQGWSIAASVATALTLILLLMQWICNKKP